ncbi:hypothetical protein [Mesorhizobium sp.]|uniref:hypothetical protein n=1 Tax=Mesorhizobium sp. TaxID=1871066 RepID=UPI000FE369E6|nr:hypothetical protein [Mesorhizobium sp.]RWH49582.1 MAG: hypothetical protein EOQ80_06655 [Mesorhizobium sp.]RWH52180.1 MAG: hypothetical protein EOQ82_27250 [Mesorhizobium sp.]RWI48388.1 MAG: hypothetical protein EOR15_13580 [Mesorhizobium sp.]RWI64037.1 MAG: hypothetical protein EOR18_30250 [Mesorhizobium sp.]RWI74812.1 MAG: hypothetical protein EOR19_20220 [Mesorhizobium sp.]
MFENLKRKRQLNNSLMLSFDCRGCMGEDHRFQWIGTVTGFEKTRFAGWAAQVKIIKRDNAGDWRDGAQGYEIVPISEPQLLAPGLFAVYR